jgi:hypothetical protein
MKTAVEWLVNQMKQRESQGLTLSMYELEMFAEQAKEMEKEKHLNWNKFLESEKTLGISDVKTIERVQWYYNEYYNATFKSE